MLDSDFYKSKSLICLEYCKYARDLYLDKVIHVLFLLLRDIETNKLFHSLSISHTCIPSSISAYYEGKQKRTTVKELSSFINILGLHPVGHHT
jgi:CRISPR/Cas system-associated exonuclease Cas4 (RecB family)